MTGPRDGYCSGKKRHYRRSVANAIEATNALKSIPKHQRRLLLLDEWDAKETKFWVQERGYKPGNITAVNFKVATAARISMSLRAEGIRGVRCKGGDVGEVFLKLWQDGERFDAIHLDFCGNASRRAFQTLRYFVPCASAGPIAFAVNILRGRETGEVKHCLDQFGPLFTKDCVRLGTIFEHITHLKWENGETCINHFLPSRSGTYVSTNGQSMLWAAGELCRHPEALLRHDFCSYAQWIFTPLRETGKASRHWAMPSCLTQALAGVSIDKLLPFMQELLKSPIAGEVRKDPGGAVGALWVAAAIWRATSTEHDPIADGSFVLQ